MLKYKYGLYAVFALALLSSCVSRKKQNLFPYLEDLPKDSIAEYEVLRTEYKLQADDIIDIQITSPVPEQAMFFSQTFQSGASGNAAQMMRGGGTGNDIFYLTGYIVSDSGTIRLPQLGSIDVNHLSVREVENKLRNMLLKYFKNESSFDVRVKLGGIRFSIIGEVRSSGRFVVLEARYNIFQVLAHIGGTTVFAMNHRVLLQRMQGGKIINYEVDLFDENIYQQPYFYIQPNDIIYVRQLKSKAIGVGATFTSNFNTIVSIMGSTLSVYLAYFALFRDR